MYGEVGPQAGVAGRKGAPGVGLGRWIGLHVEPGAGQCDLTLVGEVPVQRVALDTRESRDVAQRGPSRSLCLVKLDRSFHDPPTSLGLPLGALLQLVLPGHL